MLRLMLNEHSELSAPHPPHILRTFYPLLANYGSLQEASNFLRLAKDVVMWIKANPVNWTQWDYSADDIVRACRTSNLEGIFEAVYHLKMKVDNASRWSCKSMANVEYYQELEANGIRPFYIHLVRDGRDVACSFQKAIVGPKHIYHLAKKWSKEQRLAMEIAKELPERYLLIKYEDILMDPEAELRRICQKIGLSFEPRLLDFYKSKESKNTAESGLMWKNVVNPVQAENQQKYLRILTKEDIILFDNIAFKELEAFGYPCDPSSHFQLSDIEIAEYDQSNRDLVRKSWKEASDKDKELRQPQDEFLKLRSKVALEIR